MHKFYSTLYTTTAPSIGNAYHTVAAQVGLANVVGRICLKRGAWRIVEQLSHSK
jgi:hypothetical protein